MFYPDNNAGKQEDRSDSEDLTFESDYDSTEDDCPSKLKHNIEIKQLYLSHMSEDDHKGIIINAFGIGMTVEKKISLKLNHPKNFGLLQLRYKGCRFNHYFPPGATVKVNKMLLQKSSIGNNEFSLEDLDNDCWDTIDIITKNEKDCNYLFTKAIEDKYTVILAIQFEIIDENKSSEVILYPRSKEGTPLHRAVAEKNMKIIQTLLECKLNINAQNKKGWTALHVAVDLELSDVVDLLISNGADVNAQNWKRQVPLHYAVTKNNSKILNSLFKREVQLEITDNCHQTPLHWAVDARNENAVDILLKKGANYRFENKIGRTPFHVAIKNRDLDIIEVFLKNNVDVEFLNTHGQTPIFYISSYQYCRPSKDVDKETYLKIINAFVRKGANINYQDSKGHTPLHYAVINDNVECVQALLECNADASIRDKSNNNLFHLACQYKADKCIPAISNINIDINAVNIEGMTALHVAVEENNYGAVKLILKKNPNINMVDRNGKTALHLALESECLPIIELLLINEADVNLKNSSGKTALHSAIKNFNITINIIQSILNSTNDINAVNAKGRTALHLALQLTCLPIIELLLINEADVNFKNSSGRTALHIASANTNITRNIIKSILNSINDINAKDSRGRTAIHYAALNHNVNTLRYLLEENADVNAKDFEGKTALHLAINSGDNDFKCVKVLLDHKADINAVDNNLVTPLHLACFIKNVEVVKYLIKNGADSSMRDKDGKTVFHYTCIVKLNEMVFRSGGDINNHINDVLTLFSKEDISVNSIDNLGKTPLHYVAVNDRVSNIDKLLLNFGADINIVDKNNTSAFDVLTKQKSYMEYDWSEILRKQHIVKIKVLKLWVLEKTLDKTYRPDNKDLRWIQSYENNCNREIDSMKTIILGESNITYYDFLRKSPHDAVNYTRNQNIVNAIQSDELMTMFPIYGHFFKNHLRDSQQRSNLYDQILELLKPYIFQKLPKLCMNEVLGYLDHSELITFLKAMRLLVLKN